MFNPKKPGQETGSDQYHSASSSPSTADVQELISSSETFADSEARFHAFFDAAPLAIIVVRHGLVLYANPALARLVGVSSPNQLIGQEANNFVPPASREDISVHARARIEHGADAPAIPYETLVRRVDGRMVPVRTEISPISLPDGDAVIAFAFDLSEEQRVHNEIRDLLQREQRSGHFARQLQKLSQALSDASSQDEVALLAVNRCLEAVDAVGAIFVVPCKDENGEIKLCLSQSRGYSAEATAAWRQMNPDDPTPIAQAFRLEQAIWVGDVEDPQLIERFPVLAYAHQSGTHALAALPLFFDTRIIGVLGLTFDTGRDFDDEERVFMETVAASCAQALERARLNQERRELTRRQHESLALLNILLDSAPVGFALFDRDHRYVLVNEELARIDEYPVEVHIGIRPGQLEFEDNGGEYLEELLEEVWRSGKPSGAIDFARGTYKDSNYRHCTLALYPIRVGGETLHSGEMLGVGAILIEQTVRMRAEGALEDFVTQLEIERARFEAILQQMPSGVIIAEAPTERLILRNEKADEIWGQPFSGWETRDLPSGEPRRRGFHLDGRELKSDEWPLSRALYKGEVVRGDEIIIERGNNEMGVVRTNAAPIRDSDGTISAAIVVFDNVTERARNDAAQRFLAEAGAILVSALDEAETFRAIARLCVPRVAEWCAFVTPESRTTLAVTALAGPEPRDSPNTLLLEALLRRGTNIHRAVSNVMETQQGLLCSALELEQIGPLEGTLGQMGIREALIASVAVRGRSRGAMVWFSVTPNQPLDATTLSLAEGLARRVAVSADNARLLQEAQQARDAAQRARDEAEAANRAKDEFLAVVSHELRTPLTPILGWLELLRSPDIDESLRTQAYDVIERNAIAQAQLVNDILDVSRITTGKLRLELRDVALDGLVRQSVDSLRTLWLDKKLNVEQIIEPHLHVRADSSRVGQVVWNLLQNAIKFTPTEGKIEIALRRGPHAKGAPPTARLEIRDTGAGIEPEFLPHVFERFRQGDSSSTRKAGGLGLGLAIVKHIVELHGGQVGVQSEGHGQGTTFWVEIPLLDTPHNFIAASSPTRVFEGRLRGARILVVDDEPDTREMLARLLEEAGATVRVAPGGYMALEIVPQFGPSLIVSDIGMPGMDGLQLRQELLARGFLTPAIALTAYASGKDRELTKEAGFERYLVKPVGTQELIDVAVNLLSAS